MKHKCMNKGCGQYDESYTLNCGKISNVEWCPDAIFSNAVKDDRLLKRYSIRTNKESFEHEYGQWVQYRDVEQLERGHQALKVEHERLVASACVIKTLNVVEKNGPECNCAEMADNFLHHVSTQPTWICPAHGYKKL